jgi:hypothetical protein
MPPARGLPLAYLKAEMLRLDYKVAILQREREQLASEIAAKEAEMRPPPKRPLSLWEIPRDRSDSKRPSEPDEPKLPSELVALIRSDEGLSIVRGAFAIVYYEGPAILDKLHAILSYYGRVSSDRTGKDRLRTMLWADFQRTGRFTKDETTCLYDFASFEHRLWFGDVLVRAVGKLGKKGRG